MIPGLQRFDHVHVYVSDRTASEAWYREVLGFGRKKELETWALPHGPLMLQDPTGTIMLALFEQPGQASRSTIAFGVSGSEFTKWIIHLSGKLGRELAPVDHGLAWSIYFTDLDGNPFEITTYEYDAIQK